MPERNSKPHFADFEIVYLDVWYFWAHKYSNHFLMHPKNLCRKISSVPSEFGGIMAKFGDIFPKVCDFLIAKVSKLSSTRCFQCLCVDATPRKMTHGNCISQTKTSKN